MPPINEFENDLKRSTPRPLSDDARAAVEARLLDAESARPRGEPRAAPSHAALIGIWASGFAIGAAAMLILAPWLGSPPEPSTPSAPIAGPRVPERDFPIAAATEEPPSDRLIAVPVAREFGRRHAGDREVLTVGRYPSVLRNHRSIPPGRRGPPADHNEAAPRNTVPSPSGSAEQMTRRELMDELLDEA
ncbi:hypothetical protein [Allorhodopirellula solitaria]|uniref:Uncharacterized protein n=1 Tax=Allorhodopirellula solitaria TaxID=2527987 RepID=A0A5C5YK44_9BACT|nr:hypothetical protein [Allorhodopirellula solitaria]TWT75234.1 hypothetical protein CA85_05230 [Allorhodopirellula solitaria]